MFVSEWLGIGVEVEASRGKAMTLVGMPGSAAGGREGRAFEHARLQRKSMRKRIGLAVVAAGAMIMFLHGMVLWTA